MSAKPKEKAIVHVCAANDGAYMVQPQKKLGTPPKKILVPLLNPNDPRLFIRNGELIKPYGIIEFAFERVDICPTLAHDRAFYSEVSRTDFDPAGCVPIKYFDIEKVADQLNAAQALVEERIG